MSTKSVQYTFNEETSDVYVTGKIKPSPNFPEVDVSIEGSSTGFLLYVSDTNGNLIVDVAVEWDYGKGSGSVTLHEKKEE